MAYPKVMPLTERAVPAWGEIRLFKPYWHEIMNSSELQEA